MAMEIERRLITSGDIARELYNPERTKMLEASPLTLEGVRPPNAKKERKMTLAEWKVRGLATAPLSKEIYSGAVAGGAEGYCGRGEVRTPGHVREVQK